jgi:hypothetical protein
MTRRAGFSSFTPIDAVAMDCSQGRENIGQALRLPAQTLPLHARLAGSSPLSAVDCAVRALIG